MNNAALNIFMQYTMAETIDLLNTVSGFNAI